MEMFSEKERMSFNDLEFEVYNYILNNSEKIPYMTIRELAKEAHVSTTTVLRFCRKVNCEGFSEFKIRFKIAKEESQRNVLKNDITAINNFLERAITKEFVDNLDVISHVLVKAKNLIFVGNGNSGVMAKYAARYFSSVGKFALHVENPMYTITLENPEESVVIIFSVSGEGEALVRNISALKAGKATIISVTNSKNSTIAKLSDYNISYYVQHELKLDDGYMPKVDITTQFPAVYLIETLARKTYNIRRHEISNADFKANNPI